MAKTYPSDPWRVAWVDNTLGSCLVLDGRIEEAAPMLKASTEIIRTRWSASSLYGQDAEGRLGRLHRR